MEGRLTGKVAVVTGAGGVLCSGFCKALAAEGAKVAMINRHADKAEVFAKEIRENGGTALAYGANVLDRESLEAAHAQILKDLGPCDILVNGAGGNMPGASTDKEYYTAGDENNADLTTFFDLNQEKMESVFSLNYMGTLLPTQIFVKDMIARTGCCVINVSSASSFHSLTKIPGYSGAKAAINNLTQWMAVHFAAEGIRVNAICPGFFVARQNYSLLFNEDGTPTARAGKILTGTPMGRFGEAPELWGTLVYLADPAQSGFVTGVVIPVDGGFSAYSGV